MDVLTDIGSDSDGSELNDDVLNRTVLENNEFLSLESSLSELELARKSRRVQQLPPEVSVPLGSESKKPKHKKPKKHSSTNIKMSTTEQNSIFTTAGSSIYTNFNLFTTSPIVTTTTPTYIVIHISLPASQILLNFKKLYLLSEPL